MGASYSHYEVPDVPVAHAQDFLDKLQDQYDKTLVITGTTTGLGKVCASTFASKNGRVIMLNRPSERAEAAVTEVGRYKLLGG